MMLPLLKLAPQHRLSVMEYQMIDHPLCHSHDTAIRMVEGQRVLFSHK